MNQTENNKVCASEIQEFYKNSKIFITGSTGFIGRLLLEKLLRSCPEVSQIYLLVRTKKNKKSQERIDDIFNDILYERLRREQPSSRKKVVIIEGDCELPDLGISAEDQEILIKNVNIIFHVAATVRFNDPLRKMVNINVRGTRDILKLSNKMEQLKMFVHVSTAYSYCVRQEIDETFYKTPIAAENLITLVDLLEEDQLNNVTPLLLKGWPNTYVFTKAVAESLVEEYSKTKPVTLIRPSIVVVTYKEPVPGWINVWYGPMALTIGVGMGVIHVLCLNGERLVDMVPADWLVNNIIAATWKSASSETKTINKATIYNYVSTPQIQVTWNFMKENLVDAADVYPLANAIWHRYFMLVSNRYLYLLCAFIMHTIPGWIVDGLLISTGKKPRLTKVYRKINDNLDLLGFFMKRDWTFYNKNVQNLWEQLNSTDQELFPFNIDHVDPKEYSHIGNKGCRMYMLKDPLSTIPQAKRRRFLFKILHYSVVIAILFLLYWFMKTLYFLIF